MNFWSRTNLWQDVPKVAWSRPEFYWAQEWAGGVTGSMALSQRWLRGSDWVHSEQNSMKRLLLVHSGCQSGCLCNQFQSGRGASYRLPKAGTTCYTEINQGMQWINECVWWWYHIIQHSHLMKHHTSSYLATCCTQSPCSYQVPWSRYLLAWLW